MNNLDWLLSNNSPIRLFASGFLAVIGLAVLALARDLSFWSECFVFAAVIVGLAMVTHETLRLRL